MNQVITALEWILLFSCEKLGIFPIVAVGKIRKS